MYPVEVEDIEPTDDGPVEEDRPDPVDRTEAANERDHPARGVGPIDPHAPGPNLLHVLGQRQSDRGHRSVAVAPLEGAVVDPDDAGVGLSEGPPQG